MLMLIIYYICHVNYFAVIMVGQACQIYFIIQKFIHLRVHPILYIFDFFLLLIQQLPEILFACLLVVVHYLPEFSKMLLHFALNNLPISLLYSVKIPLGLRQLIFTILYQIFGTQYFGLDFFHNLGYNFDLRLVQIQLIDTLCAHQSVFIALELALFYPLFQIRMDQLVFVFFTFLVWTD